MKAVLDLDGSDSGFPSGGSNVTKDPSPRANLVWDLFLDTDLGQTFL